MIRENTLLARIPTAALLLLEVLVFVGVMIVAWQVRSALPNVPLSDRDTWGYLNPGLAWMSGLGFQQTNGRDWLYPALVTLFLKTSGAFSGIVLWQKALGFIAGFLMIFTWRCWVRMLPLDRWGLLLLSLVGALPIFVQLVNQQALFFELSIRPEAVLTFFVYAQLACLILYCKYRWQKPKAFLSILLGAGAIFFAYSCVQLKPSWLFAFASTTAPVFIGLFGQAISWRAKLLTPALGIVLAALILWLPAKAFYIADSASRKFLPSTLFTIHAGLIEKSLEAKIAAMPESDPQKAPLLELFGIFKKEFVIAQSNFGTYEKLGYNPDYLFYHCPLMTAIYNYTGRDDEKFRAFCLNCYKEAALYDPVAFAEKILTQFTHFLFPEPRTFFRDQVNLGKAYRASTKALVIYPGTPFTPPIQALYSQYWADTSALGATELKLSKEASLHSFSKFLTPVALPLEIVFLVAFIVVLAWPPLHDLRLAGWVALLIFSAPLGNAATVSVVHALDMARYRFSYGGFLLMALTAMAAFVVVVLVRLARRRA